MIPPFSRMIASQGMLNGVVHLQNGAERAVLSVRSVPAFRLIYLLPIPTSLWSGLRSWVTMIRLWICHEPSSAHRGCPW